ncbi:MAG TPA: trehalose-6-phosphate synthase, partial [Myxococcaceae bacterium]|nr:trehalose-6-phosphate synthase [Myxococcaceae bacterium]
MSRVLIVSNRLPVTVRADADGLEVQPSVGGVATGLRGPHERSGGLWIGWPGLVDPLPENEQQLLARKLEAMRLVQVPLTREEVQRYYEAYCNGVLWPLFHYFASELPLEIQEFDDYERVNRRFAEAVVANHRPGDLIWVQDYQLMRVPALIRARLPEARIGFFLHIPFPSSETFRILPHREQILEGLLGADLIGFHTAAYVRHFSSSVLRTTGAWTDVDRIPWRGREVRLGVFPMGVDAASWRELGSEPGMAEEIQALRSGSDRLLVGIDRLDYTKGIPRRLLAYEQLLLRHPELSEHVRMVQVAVPSRTGVGAYQGLRETVDSLVGHINGRFATPTWSPVRYLARGLSPREVTALYRAADVLVVTPIRDGMNLVAKEYAASRVDGGGVLVLSEFAGAADELGDALLVNPHDREAVQRAMLEAASMD